MRTPFDHLWDFADPEGSSEKFEAFRPQVAGDLNLSLQLLTQIARALGLQQRFDEAHALLETVLTNITDHPDFDLVWIRLWLEKGRVFNSSGDKASARPLFLQAYEKAVAVGADYYAVDAAHMMGIVEPPDQQLRWTETAIELAERSADPEANRWLGSLYNNLGWSYHDLGRYNQALTIFKKGHTWQAAHQPGEPSEKIARWTIGRTLRSLGRLDEALAVQHELAAYYATQPAGDGYVFEELGELYLAQGDPQTAAFFFARAYDLLSPDIWLQKYESKRLARLKQLADSS